MKKVILLIGFVASLLFATDVTLSGSREWGRTVYFGDDSSTTVLFLGNAVYMDSANSGTYVQIDNTADSCSKAVNIRSGYKHPRWKYELSFTSRAVSADSAGVVFEFETRDPDFTGTDEAWVKFGYSTGYGDVAIADSVLSNNAGSTSNIREKHLFFVTGQDLRVCPDDVTDTSNDSIFVTDLRLRFQ